MEHVMFAAAAMLGAGMKHRDVASNVGVGIRTLYNWRTQPDFRQLIADAQVEYRHALLKRIADGVAVKLAAPTSAAPDGGQAA
jgi:transposase